MKLYKCDICGVECPFDSINNFTNRLICEDCVETIQRERDEGLIDEGDINHPDYN